MQQEPNTVTPDQPLYQAYLLRCWQEPPTVSLADNGRPPPTTYFLIEDVFGARQRWLFTNLPALLTQIQQMFGERLEMK